MLEPYLHTRTRRLAMRSRNGYVFRGNLFFLATLVAFNPGFIVLAQPEPRMVAVRRGKVIVATGNRIGLHIFRVAGRIHIQLHSQYVTRHILYRAYSTQHRKSSVQLARPVERVVLAIHADVGAPQAAYAVGQQRLLAR